MARAVVVYLSPDDLCRILQGTTIVSGLPRGARQTGAIYYLERGMFGLRVEHESFPDTANSMCAPEVFLEFEHAAPERLEPLRKIVLRETTTEKEA